MIFVPHGTKAEGNTPRGHSVFNGAWDFSIQVKAADQSGIVRGQIRKNRNGPADLGPAFRIGTRHVGFDVDGEPVRAPICEPLDPLDVQDAGPRLKPTEEAALAPMKDMAEPFGEVAETDWRAAATDGTTVSASDNRDNRRKVVSTALRGLAQTGLVSTVGGMIRLAETARYVDSFDDDTTEAGADHGAD